MSYPYRVSKEDPLFGQWLLATLSVAGESGASLVGDFEESDDSVTVTFDRELSQESIVASVSAFM